MLRRKTFLILLPSCLACSLVGVASLYRTLTVEHTWSDGTWWQVGAIEGSLRLIRIVPIGGPSDEQAWMKKEYMHYWRQSRESRALGLRPVTAWWEGEHKLFHETAAYFSLFIPFCLFVVVVSVITAWRRLGCLVRETANEMLRPKNALDSTRPYRRMARKSLLTLLFLIPCILTVHARWEAGKRHTRHQWTHQHLRYRSSPWSKQRSDWPRLLLLETSFFDLTITKFNTDWVIDVYGHVSCNSSITPMKKELFGFYYSSYEVNTPNAGGFPAYPACGHYYTHVSENQLKVVAADEPYLANTKPVAYTLLMPWWFVAFVLTLPTAFAFVYGPFRRARRRLANRCIACGYCLEHLTEPRCPECGEPILLDLRNGPAPVGKGEDEHGA